MLDARTVRFDLRGSDDRELPLILGLMPVLPKHAIDAATFENTTFAKPIGSGPYVVADVDPAKASVSSAIPIIGAARLPINRGLWNFDELRFDFIATPTPISKRSRPASTMCAAKRSDALADRL
jgi:peptide/nickel transport system substrate-binding protein